MSEFDWFIQIYLGVVGVGIGFIWYTYIIEPKKTIIEGIRDWYHESDDDI